ncbi:hypothetical protein SALBM217S_07226 [Streptomyces griseoloalbus]
MGTAADAVLTFRDATDADVDALVELIESAYRGESAARGGPPRRTSCTGSAPTPEGVREVVEAPDSRLLTVESEGRIVACCQLEHRGAHAYFGMFAVSPPSRARASAAPSSRRRSGRPARAGAWPRCT